MPAKTFGNMLLKLVEKYPHAVIPALSASTGATTGAIFSDEGAEARGALQGGLLGGMIGSGAGLGGRAFQKMLPTAEHAGLMGGVAGGAIGGALGQRRVSPLTLELIRIKDRIRDNFAGEGKKEAATMAEQKRNNSEEQEKQAEQTLRDRLNAFGYGMEMAFKDMRIEKSAVAQAAGVQTHELAPSTAAWMRDQMESAQSQTAENGGN